jgi:hypothetical protein
VLTAAAAAGGQQQRPHPDEVDTLEFFAQRAAAEEADGGDGSESDGAAGGEGAAGAGDGGDSAGDTDTELGPDVGQRAPSGHPDAMLAHSFMPVHLPAAREEAAIQEALRAQLEGDSEDEEGGHGGGGDSEDEEGGHGGERQAPVPWPSQGEQPLNEFKVTAVFAKAFPTVFPYGAGDPTNKGRRVDVSFADAVAHLTFYAYKWDGGRLVFPFASHPRAPHYAHNMKERHALLSQSNVYLKQNPGDANMTIPELKEQLRDPDRARELVGRMHRYGANVLGSDSYFYARREELLALCDQKGVGTCWFTFSAADNHWPDLHRILPGSGPTADPNSRYSAVREHPHLVDDYFCQRLDQFVHHFFEELLGAEWFWYRLEYQMRGGCHGCSCAY